MTTSTPDASTTTTPPTPTLPDADQIHRERILYRWTLALLLLAVITLGTATTGIWSIVQWNDRNDTNDAIDRAVKVSDAEIAKAEEYEDWESCMDATETTSEGCNSAFR